MIRPYRRLVSLLAIALLLFMQWGVAAYACPGMAPASDGPRILVTADQHVAGHCFPSLDPAAPNLCLLHGQQDGQASGQAHPLPPLWVHLPLLAVIPVIAVEFDAALRDVPPEFLARTTAPPATIRFGAFRS